MKKLLIVFCLLWGHLQAQVETLSPLTFNPMAHPDALSMKHKYIIDKGQNVIFCDTLNLPFVDDFSTNSLLSFRWIENNIIASYQNVFGTCLGPEGIATISRTFITDSSYTYSFNSTTKQTDSVANAPKIFKFFGPSTSSCFSLPPQTFYYWEPYYRYLYDTNGILLDTILVAPNPQSINYAPLVNFVQGEPGKKWVDNYAFRNNTYPMLPPTIGVATLDGLNEFGQPYNKSSSTTFGIADYLTSNPINMSGLTFGDSVYISFFFEGKGLGDKPETGDSLILEMKDVGGVWDSIWGTAGYATLAEVPNRFVQVMVQVPDRPIQNSFFHNSFQFRFKNKAALYGAVDHWHIDYVKMDAGRSAVDTIIQDIAFVYPFQPVTKNFSLMPGDQFTGNNDLRDTIYFTIQNLDPANPTNKTITRNADMLYPVQNVVAADVSENFNITDFNLNQGSYPFSEYTIGSLPADSFVIRAEKYMGSGDLMPVNDTLKYTQIFSTVMAYDDGSAEAAYGITGVGLKKVAVEFPLNFPDTLVGFQIMYNTVEANVNDLIFNFNIWDSIKLNDVNYTDVPIATLDNKKPYYIDSTNGFTTYLLDTPLIVSNKVYAGWVQTDERSLQVGFDLNSGLGLQNLYAFYSGKWNNTLITEQGSLMLRLIFDTNYWGNGSISAVKNLTNSDFRVSVYPNPFNDVVVIKADESVDIELFSLFGERLIFQQDVKSINLSALSSGMYVARVSGTESGQQQTLKIIKQ